MGMAGMTFKFTDNSQAVLSALDGQKYLALDKVGKEVLFYADIYVPKDTGRLANSLEHYVDDDAVVIGTNVKYGKYVELREDLTHKPPTRAHFLRDSITEHLDELHSVFNSELTR